MSSIDLLRHALACIWIELEKESPSLQDCQTIADEALRTVEGEQTGKLPSLSTGMDSWREVVKEVWS